MTPQEILAEFEAWVNSQDWNVPCVFCKEDLLKWADTIKIPESFVSTFSKVKNKSAWFPYVSNMFRKAIQAKQKLPAGEETLVLYLTDKTGLRTEGSSEGEYAPERRRRWRED